MDNAMSGDLIKVDNQLVNYIKDTSLDAALKPLIKEIHLFDTFISEGSIYINDEIYQTLHTGDKLTLLRENNKFDEYAVLVQDGQGHKLGYIPEKDSVIFSRLMDAGKKLIAIISNMSKASDFTTIKIGIYLVDY